jgi:pepF/M3 family oligoendopeptidase
VQKLPHWDLSNVYPGLDSQKLKDDLDALSRTLDSVEGLVADTLAPMTPKTAPARLAAGLDRAVDLFNEAWTLSVTAQAYIESFVTTDSYNTAAAKKLSELEQVQLRQKQAETKFQAWIRSVTDALPAALGAAGSAKAHAFILKETAEQGRYLMGGPEEMLAAELSLSGANAWAKLHRVITSQIVVEFELDGTVQKLPMPALINLRSHPDESVRRRGWEAENREWKKVREPLAACLNGLKGSSNTLARLRGRADCLHAAIDFARIDRATLEALLASMKDSFPMFRRYFMAKAARMGKQKLAWWDLMAPSGKTGRTYTWEEARSLVLENFSAFSPRLRDFAARVFDSRWIDAEPRDGKSGGGFCSMVPGVKESRILVNFDGSLDQVSTVSHELGHAFHNDCAFAAGKTMLQQSTPMTMAETASIMCETIVNQAILSRAADPAERLAVLENSLVNASQVIVDIYSRYLFEREVMERREKSELSADDLCDIMDRAQAATYGEALDERFRQPYMWTWKPHYYSPELNFYNFPYAFGLLFGTGLYAVSRARGAAFVKDYEALLASTGEATAADLAARFSIDIRTRAFWDSSMAVIARSVDAYCAL